MEIKFGENTYTIKYGYKPTLKSQLLSRFASVMTTMENEGIEGIEKALSFLPEAVLVGLQTNHANEFGYDLDTKKGYEEQLKKVDELLSVEIDNGTVDCYDIIKMVNQELIENGFFGAMLKKLMTENQAKSQNQSTKSKKS